VRLSFFIVRLTPAEECQERKGHPRSGQWAGDSAECGHGAVSSVRSARYPLGDPVLLAAAYLLAATAPAQPPARLLNVVFILADDRD